MNRLRVVHVGNLGSSPNGVHTAIRGIATNLRPLGIDVEVWHLSRRQREIAVRSVDGTVVVDLPRFRAEKAALLGFPRRTAEEIRRRTEGVDVLHLHSVYQGENVSVRRLVRDVPLVISPHGGCGTQVEHGRSRALKWAWRVALDDPLFASAAVIHAVSDGEAIELEGRSAATVATVPNALGRDAIAERPMVCATGPMVFVGRLAVEQKGLDLLLEGYGQALRAGGDLPDLVLAGPDFRGGAVILERAIDDLGLRSKVTLTGSLSPGDRDRLFDQARAFVHTSRWDGLPFGALEAMGRGIPVIVTPGTRIAGLVVGAEAGWSVDASPAAIAAELAALGARSPAELQAYGTRALDLVRRQFTWDTIGPRMADLYRSLAPTAGQTDATGGGR